MKSLVPVKLGGERRMNLRSLRRIAVFGSDNDLAIISAHLEHRTCCSAR